MANALERGALLLDISQGSCFRIRCLAWCQVRIFKPFNDLSPLSADRVEHKSPAMRVERGLAPACSPIFEKYSAIDFEDHGRRDVNPLSTCKRTGFTVANARCWQNFTQEMSTGGLNPTMLLSNGCRNMSPHEATFVLGYKEANHASHPMVVKMVYLRDRVPAHPQGPRQPPRRPPPSRTLHQTRCLRPRRQSPLSRRTDASDDGQARR